MSKYHAYEGTQVHGIDVQVAMFIMLLWGMHAARRMPHASYSYHPLTYVILSINLAYSPLQSSHIYIMHLLDILLLLLLLLL